MLTLKKALLGLLIGGVALAACVPTETPPQDDPLIPSNEALDAMFDVNGIYDDDNGGTLFISEAGELTFAFEILVVRGPTAHTGELSGIAQITGETATFVDTNEEAFIEGNPCRLTFTFVGDRIEVKGENTLYYHGARAYFDGTYEWME